jgi:GNAT superfamily N-acetyltransferase
MTARIRVADRRAPDLELIVSINNAVTPEDPTSLEELRWSEATYPGGTTFIAETDGHPVGVATTGRIYVYAPEFEAFWATIKVLPEARRRGLGGALLLAVSERAGAAGKVALHIPVTDDRPEAIEFFRHRGFVEYERAKMVGLALAGRSAPAIDPPAGILITSLAGRPDLVDGVHLVALEAYADIPGGEEPMAAGDLAEFRARDVDRPGIPADGFMLALDQATGRVVGFASLMFIAGQQRQAWHDMTAVARDWRGRGLAGALKRATVAWAIVNGLDELKTGNDVDNAPMRAVNARLGYQPLPDELVLRGPLFSGIMES